MTGVGDGVGDGVVNGHGDALIIAHRGNEVGVGDSVGDGVGDGGR